MFTTQERQLSVKNTWSIIHWTTNQACKRKQCSMEWFIPTKSFIFCSTGRLVTDQVWIRTAQSGWTNGFVSIHHDFMIGCFLHCIEIMIIQPLPVMMLTAWDYIAYISALHSVVAVIFHKLVSFVHIAFIVTDRCRGFMVHHQLYPFILGIFIQHFHIKVGIWSDEIKHIIF